MQLIVLDLDNTLLRSDKTISEYTLSIFNKLRELGLKIAFATARSESSASRFIEAVKPDAVISCGGSLVKYNGSVIHRCTLSKETSNRILTECLNNEKVGFITLETDSGYYVNWKHPLSPDYACAINTDFSRPLKEDTYKMSIQIFSEEEARKIAEKFSECGLTAVSGEDWYFFANKDSNKMNGIKALAAELGIKLDKIISFGDDFNDIEMIKGCGSGVAMGNAIDEVKDAANYICDTNDHDGVAKWLELML